MLNKKISRKFMGILLVFSLITAMLFMPLEYAFAYNSDGAQSFTKGTYCDLPEKVDDYLASGKTLEFDLNILIESTDIRKLRFYDGNNQVSSDFLLRNGDNGLNMVIEPIEDGWYHYAISLSTVPHYEDHEGSALTRIRAATSYPAGTLINNITVKSDIRSLPEAFTEDYDTVTLADLG
ncbi:MAG: hypothetical protein IJT84_02155, partial [Clostridia bacterium]|nr:hypothetical protein [Clostridia bacterium]